MTSLLKSSNPINTRSITKDLFLQALCSSLLLKYTELRNTMYLWHSDVKGYCKVLESSFVVLYRCTLNKPFRILIKLYLISRQQYMYLFETNSFCQSVAAVQMEDKALMEHLYCFQQQSQCPRHCTNTRRCYKLRFKKKNTELKGYKIQVKVWPSADWGSCFNSFLTAPIIFPTSFLLSFG